MKITILTYGLIGGVLMVIFTFIVGTLHDKDMIDFGKAELYGYAFGVIALSMIFFGIKSYRDNYGSGTITFWKGMQIGLLITSIGSVMYVVGAELYTVVNPAFTSKVVEKYKEYETQKLKQKGASREEIDAMLNEFTDMLKMMENPFARFVIYLIEMLPVGLIITILSAALLRKRTVLPAVSTA